MRALLILFVLITAGTAFAQWLPEPRGGGTIYVVRPNDTLWDVTERFFDNPMLWPRLWELNPFIDDPNLIYPGEVLSLRPPALPVVKLTPDLKRESVKVPTPPPPVYYFSPGGTAGFIPPDEWENMGSILTSEPPKILFSKGDMVYVNVGAENGVRPGDMFTVFRTGREVFHPLSGRKVGNKVALLGELEIEEVIGKHLSASRITDSFREMTKGAKIRPQETFVKEVVLKRGTRRADGIIIETVNATSLAGLHDVVYVDIGSDDDIVPGSVFSIYKYPRTAFDPDRGELVVIPGARVGKLVALYVDLETSTCIVIEISRQIEKGDIVSLELDFPHKL